MTTSFYNGISGLMSFQNGIDVWGDNIANINTPGFKQTNTEFASIFAKTLNTSASPTSDIGMGSYMDATTKDMSIGSLEKTDNRYDLAIGGKGWFAVKNNGETFYTRNGSFTKDSQGYLVNDNGEYLMVANADNLIKQPDGTYTINRDIKTDTLLPSSNLSPIALPDNVILPAVPTKNVKLSTNLNDDYHVSTLKAATSDIDMSALYGKDGNDLQIRNSQNLLFGFGNKVTYNSGLLSSEYCFADDKKDSKPVDIDFTLNSKEIKLTLPDGSTKEQIASAIASALQKQGFNASSNDGTLTINTQQKFILTSNTPLMKNASAAVLTYTDNRQNDYDFSTMGDFVNDIQKLATSAFNDDISVSLDDKGRVVVTNNTLHTINSYTQNTENSNDEFMKNLGRAGNVIYPQTSNKSYEFNVNSQSFGGYMINNEGDKIPVTLTFTKEKVTNGEKIWNGEISMNTPDGEIKTSQQFVFNDQGELLTPKQLTFNGISYSFDITSYAKSQNDLNYSFSQDGIEKGYLKDYQIDDSGKIIALFSNAKESVLGQIPVFHFQNEQGLANIGSNDFMQTSNSGNAFLYTNENGEYIPSKILSSTLETSNVNFSQAMSELIITQKAYQASAKTVTTSDEMIQKAINMKS